MKRSLVPKMAALPAPPPRRINGNPAPGLAVAQRGQRRPGERASERASERLLGLQGPRCHSDEPAGT